MDTWVAGALGLLLGLILATVISRGVRGRQRRHRAVNPELPATPQVHEELTKVLAILRDDAILIDASGTVVQASAAAAAHGLVRGHTLTHPELRSLAADVQRDGTIREAELELPRGPLAQGRMLVGVRVAPLGGALVLALVEDRTKARRVEDVRRDFVVNVSHELKTPVGGLALLAEAVEEASDDPVAANDLPAG